MATIRQPAFRPWYPARPDQRGDAYRHLYRVVYGTHLLVRLYARRKGIPALLRIPLSLQHVYAWTGTCNEYFPDVYVLGARGR